MANTPRTKQNQTQDDAVLAALQILRMLRYRKKYVVLAVVAAALLGGLYYCTATRIYQAQASLMVTQTGQEVFWNTSMSSQGGQGGLLPTFEKLITSDVVVDSATQKLAQLPEAYRVDFAHVPRDEWPMELRKGLSARSLRRTNLLQIIYRSKDRETAKAVVRTVIDSYLDYMDKNHKDVSVQIITMLDEERREIDRRIVEKERELIAAKRRNRDLGIRRGSNTVHPAIEKVSQLNQSLLATQKERIQLQGALVSLKQAVAISGDLRPHLIAVEPIVGREMILSTMGLDRGVTESAAQIERKLIADRARLDAVLEHFGSRHPEVIELNRSIHHAENFLAGLQSKVNDRIAYVQRNELGPMLTSMVEQKLAQARAHEEEIQREYTKAEAEAVDLNGRLAELAIGENELERLRLSHSTLLNRIETLDMHKNQADVRVAIVGEPKTLERAVSPQLSVVLFLVLLGGCGGGAAIAYIVDLLDDRFRTLDELEQQLALPVLATVRRLPDSEERSETESTLSELPQSAEVEAFRTLRTAMAFSSDILQRLAITSSEPGDGKTTLLAHLAIVFAQAEKRTLLIDADMRRPGLSKLMGRRGASGLSDLLQSADAVSDVGQRLIEPTAVPGLDLLASGPRPVDPAELLSRQRMADLIAWAEQHYDQILIDCPPILAASDAAIVGRLVDGVVLVVQPEKNHRRAVIRATETLRSLKINLIGAVANLPNDEHDAYYGSGSEFDYGYAYDYGSDLDQDEFQEASTSHTELRPAA